MTRSKSSAKSKIAVSVPRASLDRVRRAVKEGRAASVSAYVSAAIEERAKLDDLADLLAQMLAATGGPLTPAERRAADQALDITPRRKRRAA
ncbi:MAG: toxin-antitoxin system antitoxin subunit [Chloroflexi bacterium]|nr:toxin-antitoxin system antitoxin subunit [Chloroflexota bacterium]